MTALQPMDMAQCRKVGLGVRRPEDVVVSRDGAVWLSDQDSACAKVLADGSLQRVGKAGGAPNGINMDRQGRLLAKELGLCLRRDPGNTLLQHLSDLGQQFRVLKCLENTPLPTPKTYWYESDPTILGTPFLVMEKVPGTCPSPWGREGLAFYRAAAERGRLPKSFTNALTILHTLDWRAAGLDWELQVIGDPMYDVAYVLSALNREGTPLLSNLVERDAFFRDYEAATGFKIDEAACRYYYVLYAMRTAAFWMSASGLYASGRSNDIRLARKAWALPVVLSNAAKDLGY